MVVRGRREGGGGEREEGTLPRRRTVLSGNSKSKMLELSLV